MQKKDPQRAFQFFQHAADLAPKNVKSATARELARQQLVYAHIQHGNQHLAAQRIRRALNEFRAALELDPTNDFALQRVRDLAAPELRLRTSCGWLAIERDRAAPRPWAKDLPLQRRLSRLYRAARVATSKSPFSSTTAFVSRRAKLDLDDVDFYTALQVGNQLSKSFGCSH